VQKVIQLDEQGIDRKGSRWVLVGRRDSTADPERAARNDVQVGARPPHRSGRRFRLSHRQLQQLNIALRHQTGAQPAALMKEPDASTGRRTRNDDQSGLREANLTRSNKPAGVPTPPGRSRTLVWDAVDQAAQATAEPQRAGSIRTFSGIAMSSEVLRDG
jgi:hypothetical protein